jgi:S1-C subfamily serine protease
MDWATIQERYRNSVLQIRVSRAIYSPVRPYRPPRDEIISGSGFIVDIDRGLVLTNAHVVADAIVIGARVAQLGAYDMTLRLISICREKDVALCQISDQDLLKLASNSAKKPLNMVFGDSASVRETDKVMAIGFPMGHKNVNFVTGVVSGFHSNTPNDDEQEEDEDEGNGEEEPSFIQITAPINKGNSGGPLVNRMGQVIGINAAGYLFSQNIGYAIGSRTVLSVYREMAAPVTDNTLTIPYVLITPEYSFEFNRTNQDLFHKLCPNDGEVIREGGGVYIKQVYPNSCFKSSTGIEGLSQGDIIMEINYLDIYSGNSDAFDVVRPQTSQQAGRVVVGQIDSFGDVNLDFCAASSRDIQEPCRKISIKEIFDTLPIGAPVSLVVYRSPALSSTSNSIPSLPVQSACSWYKIAGEFQFVSSTVRTRLYPRFTPFQYKIIAGLCIVELTLNHLEFYPNLRSYGKGPKRFKSKLIITQVFPDTAAASLNNFREGISLKTVNGVKVGTVEELEAALLLNTQFITFISDEEDLFIIDWQKAKKEDAYIAKVFNI